MLAKLMQDTAASDTAEASSTTANTTDTMNASANIASSILGKDTNNESKADEATATKETSIPANNAHKPPDQKVRAEAPSKCEVVGVEVGKDKGDGLSEPG